MVSKICSLCAPPSSPPCQYPVSHSLPLFFLSPQPSPLQPPLQPASPLLRPVLSATSPYWLPCTEPLKLYPRLA